MTNFAPTAAHESTPTSAPPPRRWEWVRPLALRSIVGALVAAAGVGIVSALAGSFGTVSGQAFFTVALFVAYALVSWFDADISSKVSSWFGTLSLAVTVYLLALGVLKIWFPHQAPGPSLLDLYRGDFLGAIASTHPDFVGEFLAWCALVVIARVALLHVHLLRVINRRYAQGGVRIVAQITFGLVGILAALLSLPLIVRGAHLPDLYWRAVAAVAILDSLGTILVPLVHSLFHRAPKVAPSPVQARPAPRLKWPEYEDGRPLPSLADGTPDFSGTARC